MDWLCTAQRAGTNSRARAGHGHESMDYQYRCFLRRFAAGSVEFHYDTSQYADQRDVVDAHAPDVLGLVYNSRAGTAFVPGAAWRRHTPAAGPSCSYELLY